MMEVGQLLRQTREAQELSLADVEEQTKIRQSFLIALEAGNWDDLPNEVVARGFLRNYAQFLGLDADDLLAQTDGSQPAGDEATPAVTPSAGTDVAQPAAYKPINLDLYDDTPTQSDNLRRVLMFVLALIPVILLAFLLVKFGLPLLLDQSAGMTANPTVTATLPPEGTPPATPLIVLGGGSTPAPGSTDTPTPVTAATETPSAGDATATPMPTATLSPTPSQTPTVTATPIQQLVMRMEIIERSWVRVAVDGETQLESLLDPVYVQEFVAQESIQLRTGNAAGVILTLNGEELPPLGDTAEVVDYIWVIEEDGIAMMTPTPEPEPTGSPTVTPETEITETPPVEPNATETPAPTVEPTAELPVEPDTPTPEQPTPEPPNPEPETTETPTPEG